MKTIKTPGVYIVEKNAFPNSVVEVATAVPAFIGYTEYAKNGKSLLNVPFKISSLVEYEQYFGGAPKPKFTLKYDKEASSEISVDQEVVKKSLSFLQKQITTLVKTKENDYSATINKIKETFEAVKEPLEIFNKALLKIYGTGNEIVKETEDVLKLLKLNTETPKAISNIDKAFNKLLLKVNDITIPSKKYTLSRNDNYNFYYHLRLFFANGGGACYIVSVGNYEQEIEKNKLEQGVAFLKKEQEPTIVVVPEAVCLKTKEDCYDIYKAALKHCGGEMKNRVALLDIYNGSKGRAHTEEDAIKDFRIAIGTQFLDFGAAYYPWLNTSIVSDNEISFRNFLTNWDELKSLLSVHSTYLWSYISNLEKVVEAISKKKQTDEKEEVALHKIFVKQSTVYAAIIKEGLQQLNLLPPTSAMAGIYTLIDNTREVWKAPANVGISNVISPAVNISHTEQENLNVPLDGKAVNAIRYFVGEGVKVWGARTLDGNSLDWRYINVRRTMIMLEESIKNATKAFVFEPNTANTWVSIRSMINNFLNGIWKRGGLAGAVPDDAFNVHVGLGETMTPEDILEGIMRVTVLVAISRPAEFIEITFQQQMQKS
ncbi:phage tail sheath family protein [Pedobacter sp.]|uniref:phage tail sheath family protein n=1 Tax=Pedobacter sp. TaxID=1411316 RepID=UPI00396CF563